MKQKAKKSISLLLALIMSFSLLSPCAWASEVEVEPEQEGIEAVEEIEPVEAEAEEPEQIASVVEEEITSETIEETVTEEAMESYTVRDALALGVTTNAEVGEGDTVYYSFTPEEDGIYVFYSSADTNTYGYLYDGDWKRLASNDNGGEGRTFRIISALNGGSTYYCGIGYYSHTNSETIPVTVEQYIAPTSGTCGDNLTWSFDVTTATLTISGTGGMTSHPWTEDYQNLIQTVVLEDGVTSIGYYAFHICTGLTSVTIPDSVTSIGDYAFCNCSSLTSVAIPDSVTTIGEDAFGFYYYWERYERIALDGYTISGYTGSAAETYANDNGIAFVSTGTLIIPLTDAVVTVPAQTYTGKALTPAPTVKLNGKTLKKGTDYTVSYQNNTNAGTAKVIVTGSGHECGHLYLENCQNWHEVHLHCALHHCCRQNLYQRL